MHADPLLPPPPVRDAIRAQSLVGPVTLMRYFRGQLIQPASRTRIERAMRELKLEQYLPAEVRTRSRPSYGLEGLIMPQPGGEAPQTASPQSATAAPGPVPGEGEGAGS